MPRPGRRSITHPSCQFSHRRAPTAPVVPPKHHGDHRVLLPQGVHKGRNKSPHGLEDRTRLIRVLTAPDMGSDERATGLRYRPFDGYGKLRQCHPWPKSEANSRFRRAGPSLEPPRLSACPVGNPPGGCMLPGTNQFGRFSTGVLMR